MKRLIVILCLCMYGSAPVLGASEPIPQDACPAWFNEMRANVEKNMPEMACKFYIADDETCHLECTDKKMLDWWENG